MLIDIIRCIICILAVYGLLGLILGISEMIRCRMTGPRPKVRVVLLVLMWKNRSNTLSDMHKKGIC